MEPTQPCVTIQHAVTEASAGDTIQVAAGTYTEDVTIPKSVTLLGPNAGVDPNTASRVAEATVDGGVGRAFAVTGEGVTIDGFSITAAVNGAPIYTHGADVDRLTVSDDILGATVAALALEAGGEEIAIERNRVAGGQFDIFLNGAATFDDLAIKGNVVVDSQAGGVNGIFGGRTIEGLELEGNTIEALVNIAANTYHAVVAGNDFGVERPGEMSMQAPLHESTVTGNSFEGDGTTGCLQLYGPQYGAIPSSEVVISENTFHACNAYGIQLSAEVEAIEITGNTITDSYDGVDTRSAELWDVTGKEIHIAGNRIVGSTHMGVDNTVEGTLDARDNWWGCNAGPGESGCDSVGAGVEASPYVVLTGSASASELEFGGTATVTALVDTDSNGAFVAGVPGTVTFASQLGSFQAATADLAAGSAGSTFAAGSEPGPAGITVGLDGEGVAVPLTIVSPPPTVSTPPESPPTPTPTPPAAPSEAQMESPARPVSVQGAEPTVGTISCGEGTCQVDSKAAVAKLGGKSFKLKVIVPATISAGNSAAVKVVLPKSVRKALAKAKVGTVRVTIAVIDANGQTVTQTIRVKIKQLQKT